MVRLLLPRLTFQGLLKRLHDRIGIAQWHYVLLVFLVNLALQPCTTHINLVRFSPLFSTMDCRSKLIYIRVCSSLIKWIRCMWRVRFSTIHGNSKHYPTLLAVVASPS